MKTIYHDTALLEEQNFSYPQIYFDEPECDSSGKMATAGFNTSPADILLALDKLLSMLDSRRDWKVVSLRAKGLSYPLISQQLGIGVATIVRLMRRIEDCNPELGYLLTHVEVLHKKEENTN